MNDFSRSADLSVGVLEVVRVFRAAAKRLKEEFPGCTFVISSVCQTQMVDINRSVAAVNSAYRKAA